jgi:hypothetical protein
MRLEAKEFGEWWTQRVVWLVIPALRRWRQKDDQLRLHKQDPVSKAKNQIL